MKDGIRRSRQRHAPGAAELVVEEHRPFQTNAIEYVGENVHACYVSPRTIGHKIWIARRGIQARNIAKVAAARKLLTCVFYAMRDGHVRSLAARTAQQEAG